MFSMSDFPPTSIAIVEHLSSSVTVIMAPKRSPSKNTTEINTREAVESMLVKFPVYFDTQFFIEK